MTEAIKHNWKPARLELELLITQGKIERVPANSENAKALLNKSRQHIESALQLAGSDVELSYGALHAANRKAMTAVLLTQGLRPTRVGGHVVVLEAIRVQCAGDLFQTFAPYTRIRRTRNAGDYFDSVTATDVDVRADALLSQAIVELCGQLVELVEEF